MKVILYTIHCPGCEILKKMLIKKNIECMEVTDIDVMTEKGLMSVPMLEVDGEIMDYKQASDWIGNN